MIQSILHKANGKLHTLQSIYLLFHPQIEVNKNSKSAFIKALQREQSGTKHL